MNAKIYCIISRLKSKNLLIPNHTKKDDASAKRTRPVYVFWAFCNQFASAPRKSRFNGAGTSNKIKSDNNSCISVGARPSNGIPRYTPYSGKGIQNQNRRAISAKIVEKNLFRKLLLNFDNTPFTTLCNFDNIISVTLKAANRANKLTNPSKSFFSVTTE